MSQSEYSRFIGKDIVVDTDGPILYIGTLDSVTAESLVFGEVDVHHVTDGNASATNEVYVMESKKLGVRTNRKATYVRIARIMSVSLLDDVIGF